MGHMSYMTKNNDTKFKTVEIIFIHILYTLLQFLAIVKATDNVQNYHLNCSLSKLSWKNKK